MVIKGMFFGLWDFAVRLLCDQYMSFNAFYLLSHILMMSQKLERSRDEKRGSSKMLFFSSSSSASSFFFFFFLFFSFSGPLGYDSNLSHSTTLELPKT
jgi:hypothetical protein